MEYNGSTQKNEIPHCETTAACLSGIKGIVIPFL